MSWNQVCGLLFVRVPRAARMPACPPHPLCRLGYVVVALRGVRTDESSLLHDRPSLRETWHSFLRRSKVAGFRPTDLRRPKSWSGGSPDSRILFRKSPRRCGRLRLYLRTSSRFLLSCSPHAAMSRFGLVNMRLAYAFFFAACGAALVSADGPYEFRLPEGFSIERVAGPPEIQFPMFATLDDRGRLFVAESSGLDLYAELTNLTRKCRISMLEDRDGDGRYEHARVFADQLVFPMGLCWRDGCLYVCDPPEIVAYDINEDGTAGTRQDDPGEFRACRQRQLARFGLWA